MAGSNAEDRWFDKSMGGIYFENGTIGLLGDVNIPIYHTFIC